MCKTCRKIPDIPCIPCIIMIPRKSFESFSKYADIYIKQNPLSEISSKLKRMSGDYNMNGNAIRIIGYNSAKTGDTSTYIGVVDIDAYIEKHGISSIKNKTMFNHSYYETYIWEPSVSDGYKRLANGDVVMFLDGVAYNADKSIHKGAMASIENENIILFRIVEE